LPNTTTIEVDNLHLKSDFNSNEKTIDEDTSHLLKYSNHVKVGQCKSNHNLQDGFRKNDQ
jgi:hypothetical protein